MIFDFAIIGAGINGCACSYFLTKEGFSVALFDHVAIASGGSGAAGAFISPKISKKGDIQSLIESAYLFSLDFYNQNFPSMIKNSPLLHIARDEKENKKVKEFKESTALKFSDMPDKTLSLLSDYAKEHESLFLERSATVDAKRVCEELSKDATFFKEKVTELNFNGDHYIFGDTKAKKVILANGAYTQLLNEPYINLRGIWGHRIDVKTTTALDHNIHNFVSISASDQNNILAIGATHNVHFHPERSSEAYDLQSGRDELIEKALKSVKLENIEILADHVGLRCGSNDYFPYLGKLVKTNETLDKFPQLQFGKSVDERKLIYYENLYMINGVGGYGFVLAPYIAKILCDHIIKDENIDHTLEPSRLFFRYAKKVKK
jgi:tRNA 5-methylaminomethyl-2-thiouridine biosynthesis bifunctional protein